LWKIYVKVDLRKVVCEDMKWIQMDQDYAERWNSVYSVQWMVLS